MFIQFCDSLPVNGVCASWSIGNASYNLVSIPGVLGETLSKSAHHTSADMNRNTTHHAVALTELSCRHILRINHKTRLYRKRLWTLFFARTEWCVSGSTPRFAPWIDSDRKNSSIGVSSAWRKCEHTANIRRLHAFLSAAQRSAEYSLSRLSRQVINFAADQLITVCGNAVALCMPFSCSTTPIWHSQNLVCGVGFCAILYTVICCLVSETILLTSPTKILLSSQSQTAYLPVLQTSGLLFILIRTTPETPCPAAIF